MGIKVIANPSSEPISLSDMKSYLRIATSVPEDDSLITSYIQASREYYESIQNKSYMPKTLELALDKWPCKDYIELKRPPVQSVTSVKYYDINDIEYTLSSDDYYFDDYSFVPRIQLKYNKYFPPTTLRPNNAVIIRYVAGYLNSNSVPMTVVQAIKLLVAYWYENREAGALTVPKEIEFSVKSLLGLDKVVNI